MRRLLVLFLLLGVAARAQDLPPDEWLALSLRGARIGYSHTASARENGLIVTRVHTETRVERMGSVMQSVVEESYTETEQGQPCALRYDDRTGARMVVEATLERGKIRATVQTGDQTTHKETDLDPEVRFPVALDRRFRASPPAVGKVITFKRLNASRLSTEQVRFEVVGRESIDGQEFWKVRSVSSETPGLEEMQYLDDQWQTRRIDFTTLGMRADRCSPEQAMAPVAPGTGPDMLVTTGLPCDVPLLRPRQATQATWRIHCTQGTLADLNFAWEGQQVESRTPTTVTLKVTPPPLEGEPSRDVGREYLSSNSYLHCDNPRIVVAAHQAAGSSTGSEAVRKLRNWVVRRVAAEGDMGFATDLEALDAGHGDCTERAVLLASLCRALGIPSRIALGFAYGRGRFVGHCWTEVRLDHRWQPVDAALCLDDTDRAVDATHIKLADSSLEEGRPRAEGTLSAFGRLEVEAVEVKSPGHVLEGAHMQPRTTGSELRYPSLGLALRVPDGWSSQPQTDLDSDLRLAGPAQAALAFTCLEKGRDYEEDERKVYSRGEACTVAGLKARKLVIPRGSARTLVLVVDRGDTVVQAVGRNLTEATLAQAVKIVEGMQFSQP